MRSTAWMTRVQVGETSLIQDREYWLLLWDQEPGQRTVFDSARYDGRRMSWWPDNPIEAKDVFSLRREESGVQRQILVPPGSIAYAIALS